MCYFVLNKSSALFLFEIISETHKSSYNCKQRTESKVLNTKVHLHTVKLEHKLIVLWSKYQFL